MMCLNEIIQSSSPTAIQNPAFHHESAQTYRQSAEGAEVNETAEEEKETESGTEAEHGLPEVDSGSSEDQYDDLYMFIPGDNPENNSQEPLMCSRPPLLPPRPAAIAFQLEKPHFTLQGKFKVKTAATKTTKPLTDLHGTYSAVASLYREDQLVIPRAIFLLFFN